MINWTWEIVDLQRETTDGFVFSARYILCGQQTVGSMTYYDSRGGIKTVNIDWSSKTEKKENKQMSLF